ncbi:T9SS type A sorting domain-containing protein [Tellurirhabdus bombi]|uniref:T9SS type A sorting domain-containing protein n=1 Tax=Tellurirhabdus bombi TaxID=2907205 RepID=UPI001F25BEBE|nr:T9SS type A sorting domain-containing protein [Tellurirhabdus bombi]
MSRMVFQRNNANSATIQIGGNYTTAIRQVEVKATPIQGGTPTDWIVIQKDPQGGAFSGTITLNGGWYKLEIRGLQGDSYVNGVPLEPVGVGEVFVIAGQSNAQGFFNYGAPRANDDRVNCVNYYFDPNSPGEPPFPSFSHLEGEFYMSPHGESAWCYGRLGDLLAARLQVPILFFNAAWGATSSQNWRVTAEGGQAFNSYNGEPYGNGQPYTNLKTALRFYAHSLGMRAVLWHQGETDNFLNTNSGTYADNLRTIIQKSRDHSGKNISWVVARVSYDDFRGINPGVVAGQNQVISSVGNVFAGPNTDGIQIPRRTASRPTEDVHFQDGGLYDLAQAWANSLNDQFFQASQPQAPVIGPSLNVACAGANTLTLNVNGATGNTNWNNGAGGGALTTSSGRYFATVRDGFGNATFTAPYEVPARPTITASGSTNLCEGQNITLTSSYANSVWSGSGNGQAITVNTAGTYTATVRDVTGCDFISDPVNVRVNPLPATPTARALNATRFCDRESTVLESTDALIYNWSNGERGRQVTIRQSGNYKLTVTDANGCTSRESNSIEVRVDPLPTRPVVALSGPTTFCADQNITLTSSPEEGYLWRSGQTGRSITLNQSGEYAVQTRNTFGCLSDPSAPVRLTVNPLPPSPTLTANGPVVFCDGERVDLTANSPFPAIWSSGQNAQTITVTATGQYTARVQDGNGCLSTPSSAIAVDAKPVPSVPSIAQVGTYTLKANGQLAGNYYLWQRDNAGIPDQGQEIKATVTGAYQAQAFIAYENGPTCYSAFSAPLTFDVFLDNDGLSIYPNPSPDKQVVLETYNNIKDATVTLYTLQGQQVFTERVEVFDERKFLNLSILPAGHYILQVRAGDFKVAKRLIVGL